MDRISDPAQAVRAASRHVSAAERAARGLPATLAPPVMAALDAAQAALGAALAQIIDSRG